MLSYFVSGLDKRDKYYLSHFWEIILEITKLFKTHDYTVITRTLFSNFVIIF